MSEATITFQVDEALKQEFTKAAKAQDRSDAQLLRDFMRDFVRQQREIIEHDAWFRCQVQSGLDSARDGSLVEAEKVEAEATAWRLETLRKLADSAS